MSHGVVRMPSRTSTSRSGDGRRCPSIEDKHRIVQALFEQVEVLGSHEVWLHPSLEAEERGWASAMSGEFRVEVRQTGRGERDCPATTALQITMRLAEPPEPCEWLRSA